MKYLPAILLRLIVFYVPLLLLVACISQGDADSANGVIDTFVHAVGKVAGVFIPGGEAAVNAGGALSKLIISAFVAGPPAAAAVTYKMKGGAFTPSGRRAQREEDAHWDALLDHAEELAKVAPALSGRPHQADDALKIIGALKSRQKKPRKAAAPKAV